MEERINDNIIPASRWKIVKQSILDKKIMREGIQHCECSENSNKNNAPTEDTTSEQNLNSKTRLPLPQQKKPTSPTENEEILLTNDARIEGSTAGVNTETRLKATGSERTDSEALPQVAASRLIPSQEETEPGKQTKPVVEHDEVSGKVSGNLDKLKNCVTQVKQRLNTLSQRFRRHRDPSSPSRNALPCESEWKAEDEGNTDRGSGRDCFLNSFEEHVPENLIPAATASVLCEASATTSPGQPSVEDPAQISHKATDHDQVDEGWQDATEKYPCENTDSSGVQTCDDAPPEEATSSQSYTENLENEAKDCEAAAKELHVQEAGRNQHRRAVENVDETADEEDPAQNTVTGEEEPASIFSDQARKQTIPDPDANETHLNQGTNNHVPYTDHNLPHLHIRESDLNHVTSQDACEPSDNKGMLSHGAIQSSSARNNHKPGLEPERSLAAPAGNDDERELNYDSQQEKAESTTTEPYSIDETNQSVSPRDNSEQNPSHETERVVVEVSFQETTVNNDTNQDVPTRIHSRQNMNWERNQASVYLAINDVRNASSEQNQGAAQRSNSEHVLDNETDQGFQVQNNDVSLLNQEVHHDSQGNENEPPDTSNAEEEEEEEDEEEEEPPDILDTGNPNSQQEDNNLRAQEPGWNRETGEVHQPTTIIGVNLRQHTIDSGAIRELESFAGASARQTVRSRSVEVVDLRNGQRVHDRHHDTAQRTVAGCLREILELVRLPRPGQPSTNDSSTQGQQSENPGDSSLLELITRFRSQLSQREHQMCLHCDGRPPDTILLNCHHCVFCRTCARLASYCPLPGCEIATLGFIFLR